MKPYTIGKLARAADVSVETIRYYERRGLIPQPPKQELGYRQYPETTLHRIQFIKHVQKLGLTLSEIGSVLDLLDGRQMNCATAADMIEEKISEVDQKIAALKQLKKLLERLSRHIGKCGDKGEMAFLSEVMMAD